MTLYAKISCSLPADEAVMAAGAHAELAYIRAILFCREHLTDGVVKRHQMARVCLGIPGKPETIAARLVSVGLLQECDSDVGGWRIPLELWCEWNPTAQEVADKREAEAQRKAEWRRSRDATVPNVSRRDTASTRRARDRQPEPEPEPEPEIHVPLRLTQAPKPR